MTIGMKGVHFQNIRSNIFVLTNCVFYILLFFFFTFLDPVSSEIGKVGIIPLNLQTSA